MALMASNKTKVNGDILKR